MSEQLDLNVAYSDAVKQGINITDEKLLAWGFIAIPIVDRYSYGWTKWVKKMSGGEGGVCFITTSLESFAKAIWYSSPVFNDTKIVPHFVTEDDLKYDWFMSTGTYLE